MDWVKWLVIRNRRITVHEIASMLGISSGAIQSIFKNSLNSVRLLPNSFSTCFVCVWISAWKQNACNSTLSLVTRFSAVLLPSMSELEMALRGRIVNDFKDDCSTIMSDSRETLLEFQAVYFTECFKWWSYCWTHCLLAKGDYFEGDSIDWKVVVFWRNKCNLEYTTYVKQPNKNVRHGRSATWIICSHIIRN